MPACCAGRSPPRPPATSEYVEVRQNLIVTLLDLYKADDDPRLLQEAASHVRDSQAALGPAPAPDTRARLAVSMGRVTFETAQRTGDFSGWHAAEQNLAVAIAALPPGHIYRPVALLEHGNLLLLGYRHFNQMSVLERAFRAFSDAVESWPPGDPNLPPTRAMLAVTLSMMADAPIDPRLARQYYDGAFGWARAAVDSTSAEDPRLAEAWNNMAVVLRTGARIRRDGALRAEGIEILRAVLRGADTPRRRRMAASNLASALTNTVSTDPFSEFAAPGPAGAQRLADLDEAARLYAVALTSTGHNDRAGIQQQLAACLTRRWRATPPGQPGKNAYWNNAVALYNQIIASAQAPPYHRAAAYRSASQLRAEAGQWDAALAGYRAAVGMLPSIASSAALRSDQEFSVSNFSGLASDAAACAIHLGDPAGALELLEAGRGIVPGNGTGDEPPTAQDLAGTLNETDSVVVLNTSALRCDALVISRSGIQAVALPGLTWPALMENVSRFMFRSYQSGPASRREREDTDAEIASVLDWLWHSAVGPVLNVLGYCGPPPQDAWPRVWWCPTGLLNFLPLHAAAASGPPTNTALDRVVSSYTPTVRALAAARRATTRPPRPGIPSLLTVALPDTPGQSPLGCVERERDAARAVLPAGTSLDGAQATRARILAEIPRHAWLLFGGHALQNASMPGSGALVPHDYQDTDLIRIHDIRALKLADAELAILSACETSRGSLHLADEASHLAGALQSTGFRHVIAAQWTVGDRVAADVTGRFFAAMQRHHFRPEATALALHQATRAARAHSSRPATWAPLMHFGP